jgi:hypothetical protein
VLDAFIQQTQTADQNHAGDSARMARADQRQVSQHTDQRISSRVKCFIAEAGRQRMRFTRQGTDRHHRQKERRQTEQGDSSEPHQRLLSISDSVKSCIPKTLLKTTGTIRDPNDTTRIPQPRK